MHHSRPEILNRLCGMQLNAVNFVLDYFTLQFDHTFLTALEWPCVSVRGQERRFGESGYRDALCAVIGARLDEVQYGAHQALVLQFSGGTSFYFSLLERDKPTDDMITITSSDNEFWQID